MRRFKNSKNNLNQICKNELGKACFVHDAKYATSTDLAERSFSVIILKKSYKIALNPKVD